MKIIQPLIRIFDFYKKSPDLNKNQIQYKSSKTTLFVSTLFVVLVILANLNTLADIWKQTKNLKVTSAGSVISQQSITPFNIGLYFPQYCYDQQLMKNVKILNHYTNKYIEPIQCSSSMKKLYTVDYWQSCMICFYLQDIHVQSAQSLIFSIAYNNFNKFYSQLHAQKFTQIFMIFQHQSYNPLIRNINRTMIRQILYLSIYDDEGNKASTYLSCDVTHVVIDDSLFDWSSPNQISYFDSCVVYAGFQIYAVNENHVYSNKVKQLSYTREKITVILSNIISFGFLGAFLSIFFTSYNNYLLKAQISKQIILLQEQQQININYLSFIFLKLLKIDWIRNLWEKKYPNSYYLRVFYILRQNNRMLSIQNIAIPMEQMYQQYQEDQNKSIPPKQNSNHINSQLSNKYSKQNPNKQNIFVKSKQQNPAIKLLQQIKSFEEDVIPYDSDYLRQPPKSFIRRIIQVFDLFSSSIQLQQQEVFTTSCFSIIITLATIAIFAVIISITGFSNTLLKPDQRYTIATPSHTLTLSPSILQIYIVAMNTSNEKPLDVQYFKSRINYEIGIYDDQNILLRPLKQNTFYNCSIPDDFIGVSNIIHFCINTTYTLSSELGKTQRIRLRIFYNRNADQQFNVITAQYLTYFRYNNYLNGDYNVQWSNFSFVPPYDQSFYNVASQKCYYIVQQNIKGRQLFGLGTEPSIIIANKFNLQYNYIDTPYTYDFRLYFQLSTISDLTIQAENNVFIIINNVLGINYLVFLFLVKCCSNYFNKQKSLRAMSEQLKLIKQKKGQCQVLYQTILNIAIAEPQTIQDVDEYKKLINDKQSQFEILNIVNIMKTKAKLEYLHKKMVQFGYIKRLLNVDQQLDQQQQQDDDDQIQAASKN